MSRPKVAITLSIDTNHGVLGHTVALLIESGMKYERHRLSNNGAETFLTLEATGDVPDSLRKNLVAIPGVHAVVSIEANQEKSPEALLQPDQPTVENILKFWQTPRALELIQQFESEFKSKEREQKSVPFGELIGIQLAQEYRDALSAQDTIEAALQQVVIPALGTFIEAEIKDNALHLIRSDFVSVPSSKLKMLFGLDQERCYVISGIVQGILNQHPSLPKTCVRRAKCVAAGDSLCVLKVEAAKSV
ncbi:hypothetical protein BegalDRAFT_1854 [Beggiatoa alba B18LD]|uniref:4-vinyl reductase 4VR domain-containing protein n=1 Tax=Beggiatoa alba B18LD TaxID=395493 RepID=I3CGI5_9GAMM|nr:hypothetical protein [Beggiatoa alba]EIJ42728.1 hypothetical protein BegalDRAFT_1854 [Beggiatoa alba B18LD]